LHGPNLAGLYSTQGGYADAEPLYERALAIREKALGPDHPDVANSLNSLGGLYFKQGGYAKADPLYRRAIKIIDSKTLGTRHAHFLTLLENFVITLEKIGKRNEARGVKTRADKIKAGLRRDDREASVSRLD
jgi:tetratricopeptide (TPR) repeat protein